MSNNVKNNEIRKITVSELFKGYVNNNQMGVKGLSGKLDIRPSHQRQYVYNNEQEKAVIDTIIKGNVLGFMHWNDKGDGTYEVIDGQQRTISICRFKEGAFIINYHDRITDFGKLPDNVKKIINNHQLYIQISKEKDPYKKVQHYININTCGEKHTPQETRNAIYSGDWTLDAVKKFGVKHCRAHKLGSRYIKVSKGPERQGYLEIVLKWISDRDKKSIDEYMFEANKNKTNADELWNYYKSIIDWIEEIFIGDDKKNYRPTIMHKVNWGKLYNKHWNDHLDPDEIQNKVTVLINDENVRKHKGIYSYVLDGDESHLERRFFESHIKEKVFEQQGYKCKVCDETDINKMEADHITPWSKGGKTTISNCQVLCKECNGRKSDK